MGVSRICCLVVRKDLPDLFLPWGQIGVRVRGGLEAAVHSFCYHLNCNKDNPDMCAIKIDMYNAFNEVQRVHFLHRIESYFPGIFSLVKWCYQYPSNLQLGSLAFKCSTRRSLRSFTIFISFNEHDGVHYTSKGYFTSIMVP